MQPLAQGVLDGSRRALARALTVVENGGETADALLADLYSQTGGAWVIGITGAPGTGKSSLVTALAQQYRAANQTVAIVAVDPTSPFTGGALLGDRIRMRDLSGDSGVFIRSMATRGSLGGLARSTRDVVRVFDSAGFDIILVETVGAGQSEVDIVRMAHTTLVVEAPGLGDDVQAIKAGILEIADILVVNKADRPGADNAVRALRAMLELGHPARSAPATYQPTAAEQRHHGTPSAVVAAVSSQGAVDAAPFWLPPVVKTIASRDVRIGDDGLTGLVEHIARHRDYVTGGALLPGLERERIEFELADRLRHALYQRLLAAVPPETLTTLIDAIVTRQLAPAQAVAALLETP